MKNKDKNRIYARAKWHDYGGGAYFVTVCTKNKEHFFGDIARDDQNHTVAARDDHADAPMMILSPIGQCLYDNLQNATMHYPYAEILLFVVMPNHWHAIIFIDGDKTPYQRRNTVDNTGNIDHTGIANMQGWLSIVIGGIKSAVTKFANENGIEFVWQTRFDDKIIRNQEAMNKIADYIENNVARWAMDCFNNVKKN